MLPPQLNTLSQNAGGTIDIIRVTWIGNVHWNTRIIPYPILSTVREFVTNQCVVKQLRFVLFSKQQIG